MAKKKIEVDNIPITIVDQQGESFISLTDIAKKKGNRHEVVIQNWMRNQSTMNFLRVWETMYNPDFKYIESDVFKGYEALEQEFMRDNAFVLGPSKWIRYTNAKGIISKKGRYGGTFAHEDIAMEFASWISSEFKLFMIREFKRLKSEEAKRLNIEWNIRRELAKAHYPMLKDAVIQHLPTGKKKAGFYLADEADLINQIVFGMTAKQWRVKNSDTGKLNMRDFATVEQLLLVSDLEVVDSLLIKWDCDKEQRIEILQKFANDLRIHFADSVAVQRIREIQDRALK